MTTPTYLTTTSSTIRTLHTQASEQVLVVDPAFFTDATTLIGKGDQHSTTTEHAPSCCCYECWLIESGGEDTVIVEADF